MASLLLYTTTPATFMAVLVADVSSKGAEWLISHFGLRIKVSLHSSLVEGGELSIFLLASL